MKRQSRTPRYVGALVVLVLPAFYMWLSPKLELSVWALFAFAVLAACIAFGDYLKRAWDGLSIAFGKDGVKFEDKK
jgi:O-antigen/teichoic acid export membrane protein